MTDSTDPIVELKIDAEFLDRERIAILRRLEQIEEKIVTIESELDDHQKKLVQHNKKLCDLEKQLCDQGERLDKMSQSLTVNGPISAEEILLGSTKITSDDTSVTVLVAGKQAARIVLVDGRGTIAVNDVKLVDS